jgi:UDP-N-acetyl-D-glucosamine dehydrogenase
VNTPTAKETKKLVVVGQGYVGLPLAMRAVEVGMMVLGVDTDQKRVDALNHGESFVEDIPQATVSAALASGRYRATTDYAMADAFDVAVITVPTPLREGLPDLSFIESAGASLAQLLRPGGLVILESTSYPGTTEELLRPILERSGLKAGVDFWLGYSPERIDPGNVSWTFVNTPKVVSGADEASLGKVKDFYAELVDEVVPVRGTREAELTKLLENTFRHVNIALVNELAVFAHQLGIDLWDSIDAASTKPFGYMRFTPGPGVGGHCLPVDPSYLSWQVKRTLGINFRFIELANDVNDHMPDYVVQRISAILNNHRLPINGSRIAILGLSYKKNVGDVRESPALRVVELLQILGADVVAVDPHVEKHLLAPTIQTFPLTPELLKSADLAVIITDHDCFDYQMIKDECRLVMDTRRRLPTDISHVHAL